MGRGGRRQMAGVTGGMLSGILSGVIWGSVVGGLVVLLAALVLDLDRGPVAPGSEAAGQSIRPVNADALRVAPVLLQRLDSLGAPEPAPDRSAVTSHAFSTALPDPRHGLVPRPAQPGLPHLVTGAAVRLPGAVPPPPPEAAPAVSPVVSPVPPATPGNGTAPRAIAPMTAPSVASAPAGLAAMAPPPAVPSGAMAADPPVPGRSATPEAPTPTALLFQMPDPAPAAAIPPQGTAGRPGTDPVPDAPALSAPSTPMPDPAPPAAIPPQGTAGRLGTGPVPGPPPAPPLEGPQVAFILDGETDAPPPDWLRARATRGDGVALALDSGGAVFAGSGAVSGYLAARAAGAPALLAYVRLDGVDAPTLDRIALRARRDGAVAVLVAPDAALWDRIGDWLEGPARDLMPVAAGMLLE